jgi:hypothetical protein
MDVKQALKEAVTRWGKTAAVNDRGRKCASTPEKRAAAGAKLREMKALPDAEKKLRRKERDEYFSESYRYRYIVGKIELGMFFSIEGSGDTWEEAFKEADERAVKWYGKKAAA